MTPYGNGVTGGDCSHCSPSVSYVSLSLSCDLGLGPLSGDSRSPYSGYDPPWKGFVLCMGCVPLRYSPLSCDLGVLPLSCDSGVRPLSCDLGVLPLSCDLGVLPLCCDSGVFPLSYDLGVFPLFV